MVALKRCDWAEHNRLEQEYHDTEWGIPVHDDRKLFELLILEGKQAGLSWATILLKRETLREAFDNFDPAILLTYDDLKSEELLQNKGIIRNKQKIKAVVNNAKAYFKLCEKHGSLDHFLWSFVSFQPIVNHWNQLSEVPASSAISDSISKELKKFGFQFVGTTTIYALMQSIGMVNDHLTYCDFYNRA